MTDDDRNLAAVKLATLFDLQSLDIRILGADIFGSGSRAAVEIRLSNGETMAFDTLREMANASILAAELAACTGSTPKITKPVALQAIATVRDLARAHRTLTDNDGAREWGTTYLQRSDVLDVDLANQADRWAVFTALGEMEPTFGPGSPAPMMVLRHIDGSRLVRSSWFATYVRGIDSVSCREIPIRMARAGWTRRGSQGRIKATRPGLPGALTWSFYTVPAGWEERTAGDEVTTSEDLNTRAQSPTLSRVEGVTRRHRVTEAKAAAA